MNLQEKFDFFFRLLAPGRALLVSGASGLGKSYNVQACVDRHPNEFTFNKINEGITTEFNTKKKNIIFYDEAHSLSRASQISMLLSIDRGQISVASASETSMKENTYELVYIFATSNPERLLEPLRNRCYEINLDFWAGEIIANAIKSKFKMTDEMANRIASLAKGTIRGGLKIAEVVDKSKDIEVAKQLLCIDDFGLSRMDRKYLSVVYNRPRISLTGIASILGADSKFIVENIEPFFRRREWIEIVPGGRKITDSGKDLVRKIIGGT
jgi:Holliday junction resolvasome RuvABC ATP-dependent DNA helicase subunit